MCGLVGEYILEAQAAVRPELLERRADRLRHRGPDDSGAWHNSRAAFSHVRLKLLDPAGGAQPMSTPRGTILAYNGEIYNNVELRAELIARGCVFQTRSDTEVLLAAYEMWGENAWDRLNGMFAFALYDPRSDRLYLVRDRLGIKPLYYRITSDRVEFASEPSALTESRMTALNPQTVVSFLRFAHITKGNASLFVGINTLEPGMQLTADPHGIRLHRWHSAAVTAGAVNSDDVVAVRGQIRHLMHLAVGRQMLADAPVGVFLSGGIDSAIIVGLLAQMRTAPPATYTIALDGDDDEIVAARSVARKWRTDHHDRVLSIPEFFAAMDDLTRKRGLPVCYPNEILLYALARHAVADVKAVLTGEGADELFGGYSKILNLLNTYRAAKESSARGNRLLFASLRAQRPDLDYVSDTAFFLSAYSWFRKDDLVGLLRPEWRQLAHDSDQQMFERIIEDWSDLPLMQRSHALLEYGHLPNLLARLDGATMAASLEGRVPFTDTNLIRFVTQLPPELKFSKIGFEKPLLRETFGDLLPPEILARPKKAFHASLELLFSSADGRRLLSNLTANEQLLTFFDRSLLDMWLTRNTGPDSLLKKWLLVSLSVFLNHNTL